MNTSKYTYHTYLGIDFTPREIEYLQQLALGKTSKGIAKTLFVSYRTVEFYVEKLKLKTGCRNKLELVIWAANFGISDKDILLH